MPMSTFPSNYPRISRTPRVSAPETYCHQTTRRDRSFLHAARQNRAPHKKRSDDPESHKTLRARSSSESSRKHDDALNLAELSFSHFTELRNISRPFRASTPLRIYIRIPNDWAAPRPFLPSTSCAKSPLHRYEDILSSPESTQSDRRADAALRAPPEPAD